MITDVLIRFATALIDKGFQIPVHIFAVSQNGNVVAAKFEANPPKE
jgi:hypothetical protein